MRNLFKHLKIIRTHRRWVIKYCSKMGIIWQGLVHDLSKYSLTELSICKYYTGKKSPHQVARDTIGYSPSWIHHYHTNKHHFQYWWDESETGKIIPMKMPYKYIIESFCDMLGASKAYNPKAWEPKMLLDYWNTKCVGQRIMHPDSMAFLEMLIERLAQVGEAKFFNWYILNKETLEANYKNCDISITCTSP